MFQIASSTSWWNKLEHSPKRQLGFLLVSFLIGVSVGYGTVLQNSVAQLAVLAGAGTTVALGIARKTISWTLIAAGLLCVGMLTGIRVANQRALLLTLIGERVTFVGRVSAFPRPTGSSYRSTVQAELPEGGWSAFPLSVTSGVRAERGSEVRVTCVLRGERGRFSCRGGIMEVTREPNRLFVALNALRDRAFAKSASLLSKTNAALLAGMVYGGDDLLPNDTREAFRVAGLSHLIAVSGANLALVIVTFYGFITAWWLPRKRAALVTLVVLALAVAFVGFDASVVRAAIMGSLVLMARWLGRPRSGGNALLLAAALMLLADPWLLSDLGFLLSFSATAGLMYLASPLETKLAFVPEFGALRSSVALALSAYLATLPVLILSLGTVSLVSPFANILAMPIAVMLFALGTLWFLTLWVPGVSGWLARPVGYELELLRFLAVEFASVRHASSSHPAVLALALFGSGALILWLVRQNDREALHHHGV